MPVMFGTNDMNIGGQPGRVVALYEPGVVGSVLSASDWAGYPDIKAIFTRVYISQSGNYQFLHTLGDAIYVYIFGDRIGQLVLSGLAFSKTCEGTAGNWLTGDKGLGAEQVLDYYRNMRLRYRRTPVVVNLGVQSAFEAFLVGMDVDMVDPSKMLFQFTLNMVLIPE